MSNDITHWKLIKWLNGISGAHIQQEAQHFKWMKISFCGLFHKAIVTIILLLFKLNALGQPFEVEKWGERERANASNCFKFFEQQWPDMTKSFGITDLISHVFRFCLLFDTVKTKEIMAYFKVRFIGIHIHRHDFQIEYIDWSECNWTLDIIDFNR